MTHRFADQSYCVQHTVKGGEETQTGQSFLDRYLYTASAHAILLHNIIITPLTALTTGQSLAQPFVLIITVFAQISVTATSGNLAITYAFPRLGSFSLFLFSSLRFNELLNSKNSTESTNLLLLRFGLELLCLSEK